MVVCSVCARPHQSPSCPRCAGLQSLSAGARVCVRVGHQWPGYERHVLAYMADHVDDGDMVLVYDVGADTWDQVPRLTASGPWTQKPTRDEQLGARDALQLETRGKVTVVGRIETR